MEVNSFGVANTQAMQTSYKPTVSQEYGGISTQAEGQQTAAASVVVGKSGTAGFAKAEKNDELAALDSKTTSDFLQKSIQQANKQLVGANREFKCSVHEKTGQYIIKIVDSETQEVIKEIPPEKTLDAVAKMWELAGIFVDARK